LTTDRLAAFSDGVIAVIITIMVLEFKPPRTADLTALAALAPAFFAYVLSFLYVGIYWNNHHHFLHLAPRASGGVLWANMHLLFWMSLIPFTTNWLDENLSAPIPTALYGFVLLMTALAWYVMQVALIARDEEGLLRQAIGRDVKGKLSPILYLAGIASAFVATWVADLFYVGVAAMWLVPDRRIERTIYERGIHDPSRGDRGARAAADP
jgi:uncharacterized membrane protein